MQNCIAFCFIVFLIYSKKHRIARRIYCLYFSVEFFNPSIKPKLPVANKKKEPKKNKKRKEAKEKNKKKVLLVKKLLIVRPHFKPYIAETITLPPDIDVQLLYPSRAMLRVINQTARAVVINSYA